MQFPRLSKSHWTALAIAGAVALWVLSGQFGNGADPTQDEVNDARAASIEEAETAAPSLRVRAEVLKAEPRVSEVVVRGRTEAFRTVELRAQTQGLVEALPVDKGDRVKHGDLVCRLSMNDRQARLEEAKALVRQRELEFNASRSLASKGYRAETETAGAQAQLDAARARVAAVEVDIAHTEIRAPFDGLVNERPAEIGQLLRIGDICATVIDDDPFLVVGQVSERDVGKFDVGAAGRARLVTGERLEGKVRFVGSRADPATRTFRVELEVPNPGLGLRDGVTAEIHIAVDEVMAHLISPAVLALDDRGVIGVRIVEDGNIARFTPVEIIGDTEGGVWVTGLPDEVTLITVGQEFVSDGQKIEVSLATPETAS